MGRGTNCVRTKDSGTYHVLVNLWLTLYKLTGWLASLDLCQPYTKCMLSHQKCFLLERWTQARGCVKIAFELLLTITTTNLMKCLVNWIPLNPHVRFNKIQPYLRWGY